MELVFIDDKKRQIWRNFDGVHSSGFVEKEE